MLLTCDFEQRCRYNQSTELQILCELVRSWLGHWVESPAWPAESPRHRKAEIGTAPVSFQWAWCPEPARAALNSHLHRWLPQSRSASDSPASSDLPKHLEDGNFREAEVWKAYKMEINLRTENWEVETGSELQEFERNELEKKVTGLQRGSCFERQEEDET